MQQARKGLPSGFTPVSTLDFADNRALRTMSFVLRVVAVVLFVPLFAGVAAAMRGFTGFDVATLWAIGISGVPRVISYLLLAAAIVGVIVLHEYVHVVAFRLSGATDTRLGTDRLSVFAWAEDWYVPRNAMVAIAIAPFAVISVAGTILFALVPDGSVSWVFIPTFVNAAAAAGDYMAVGWLLRLPGSALVIDDGQTLTAVIPAGSATSEEQEGD